MKKISVLLCMYVASMSVVLLGCTTFPTKSEKTTPPTTVAVINAGEDNTLLTEQEAINKVIKDNPRFPDKSGSKEYTENIGGKETKSCNVTYATKIEPNGKDAFYVTLTKTWDTKINDETPVVYTKYNVTKGNTVIVDSKTDFEYLNSMK